MIDTMVVQSKRYTRQVISFLALNFFVGRIVARTILHRLVHGPKRPGWSLLYELMVAIMAAGIPEDETTPVHKMRHDMELLGNTPLPRDASITPVTAGGVDCEWVSVSGCRPEGALLYIHGGGYVAGSPATHRSLVVELSRQTRLRALVPDYRLAPEDPFPAALIDVWSVYWRLLASGFDPQQIVIAGDSAGGGLTMALLLALRDAGLPLPAAAVCLSPWTDLTLSGHTLLSNADADYLNMVGLRRVIPAILDGADPRTPMLSPIYADLHGLPPLMIQAGTAEMLYDDAARLAKRAVTDGVHVEFEAWENMVHVWHFMYAFEPAAQQAIANIGRFVRKYTDVVKQRE
jgi:monoterpene epsilon-lactone hydrolase